MPHFDIEYNDGKDSPPQRTESFTISIIAKIFRVATSIFTEMSLFCHWIGVKFVRVAGMIVEYNPLHSGHLHLLEETRHLLGPDTAIVCAMSGNFVQRGDFALVRKHQRARAAVESGADLVLELPLPWAVSSAEAFADGGVQVLSAAGVVTDLAFGSECGEAAPLMELADCLLSPAYPKELRRRLDSGLPYAACRQAAVEALMGPEKAALLESPNNILGVEYCKALLRRGSVLRPLSIRREGSTHDGALAPGTHPSASALRALLRQGETELAMSLLPPAMRRVYQEERAAGRAPVFAETCERAVLARLRAMTEADFFVLDQGKEGLCHRLYEAVHSAATLEEVLAAAKTKRYAYARLRRMVLWAYLGLTPADVPETMPYLRPLAANETGRRLLARMRRSAAVPVLTKPADGRKLGAEARRLLALEARATDLYTLAYPDLTAAQSGGEWREGPVILGGPSPC